MKLHDQSYLRKHQYANPQNLNARILIHSLFSTGQESWADFIFRLLAPQPHYKILALGCGNATQWQANQAKYPPTASITLTDMSPGMLSPAYAALGADPRFHFACCDIQHPPFENDQFDRVTANHMLYHVPDIISSLREAQRLLKPTGLFMAATNGEQHMQELYDLVHAFEPAYVQEDAKHTRFSLENGAQILTQVFNQVERILYPSDLWVTDAVLLADYVFSMWDAMDVIALERRQELIQYFQDLIDKDGGIFIRKSTGVFLVA